MVRILSAVFILMSGVAFAAPQKVTLSQKDVAELVLRQGQATKEANLTFLQSRLAPAQARQAYDWNLIVESGYQLDKSETFSPPVVEGSRYKSLISSLSLTKSIAATGSILGLNYNRISTRAGYDFVGPNTPTGPSALTQDIFGITLEQPLLGNFFGRSDRAKLRSADATYDAGAIQRADSLETVVLDTIRAFWDAYVAKETFKESLASRERYKTLVAQVRRKSSYGYANPAELSQISAEYEGQEQSVKTNSTTYLQKVENLATLLDLPADTEIEFAVSDAIPEVPKLTPVQIEKLRAMRAQSLLIDSARESLVASKSDRYPSVNLVGRLYSSGFDESAGTSFSSATSGSHPKYYAGVKLAYTFGADFQSEQVINRQAGLDLAQSRLELRRLQQVTTLNQAERGVQSTYGIIQSAVKEKEFRERAVKELTRSYGQGRTEIKILIDAINDQFNTEVALSRAIGNYQIALNEWAAARDELVPDRKEEGK